jgi:3-hydroxyacyl-CoA dehydrogenase
VHVKTIAVIGLGTVRGGVTRIATQPGYPVVAVARRAVAVDSARAFDTHDS